VLRLCEAARAAGFSVAGLAAPAVRQGGRLVGFDAVDLRTGAAAPLARPGPGAVQHVGRFGLLAEGLALGREALHHPQALSADLVVVDEFGPLELRGGGWRDATDRLVAEAAGLILLVVREELVAAVGGLFGAGCRQVPAADPAGVACVIAALRAERSGRPRG
jgi:nucleoside-triphosphatase THEP1